MVYHHLQHTVLVTNSRVHSPQTNTHIVIQISQMLLILEQHCAPLMASDVCDLITRETQNMHLKKTCVLILNISLKSHNVKTISDPNNDSFHAF